VTELWEKMGKLGSTREMEEITGVVVLCHSRDRCINWPQHKEQWIAAKFSTLFLTVTFWTKCLAYS